MSKGSVASFVLKLSQLVNDPKTNDIVDWNRKEDGTLIEPNSIVVYDRERFSEEVLPEYYKGSKFCSFVRQLNAYNFEHIGHHQSNESEFLNPYFQKDKPELMKNIQRRKTEKRRTSSDGRKAKSQHLLQDEPVLIDPDSSLSLDHSDSQQHSSEIDRLNRLNEELKSQNEQLNEKQRSFDFRFQQALSTMRSVCHFAQKGDQEAIINSITSFVQSQELMQKDSLIRSDESLSQRLCRLSICDTCPITEKVTPSDFIPGKDVDNYIVQDLDKLLWDESVIASTPLNLSTPIENDNPIPAISFEIDNELQLDI